MVTGKLKYKLLTKKTVNRKFIGFTVKSVIMGRQQCYENSKTTIQNQL